MNRNLGLYPGGVLLVSNFYSLDTLSNHIGKEPPKEFLDEINRIDNPTKNPIEKQDEVKEHVEQTAQHHRPHPNDHSRPGGRDYPEYKRQQHPQAWRNGPPNPHPRRDYGMYPPNRNPPPGRHEPPPYSSRHRDRRPY